MEKVTKQLILDLLAFLDLSTEEIEIKEGEVIEINITVDENKKGILIGHHASTLDSLQLILSLMINNQKEDHQRILLDIGGYRQERLTRIMEIVSEVSSQVEEAGEAKPLPRLSPTERRQVHMALAENEKFTTFSQGEGEARRLFISLSS